MKQPITVLHFVEVRNNQSDIVAYWIVVHRGLLQRHAYYRMSQNIFQRRLHRLFTFALAHDITVVPIPGGGAIYLDCFSGKTSCEN